MNSKTFDFEAISNNVKEILDSTTKNLILRFYHGLNKILNQIFLT